MWMTLKTLNMKTYNLGEGMLAFSTRRDGGVSTGTYASMNINPFCGDNPHDIEQNRELLATRLGILPERIVVPHQVHGVHVEFLDGPCLPEATDAVVTTTEGLCVGVSTADCIPVLLYDPVHRAVAAVHAGWRGTVARIVVQTLQQMHERLGTCPAEFAAVIGPGIGLDAFEVGDEVYDAFEKEGFPMQRIARRYAKWHIDLWDANLWQLQQMGVENVQCASVCTYTNSEEFFSARRLGIRSGRIMNGIMLLEREN